MFAYQKVSVQVPIQVTKCVGTGVSPAAHVAGPLALAVEDAELAAVARAVLGHQREVLVLAKVLLQIIVVHLPSSSSQCVCIPIGISTGPRPK